MNTEPQSAVQRVADSLRAIVKQLQPGARLPSQAKLTQQFDVSRDTVQRAQQLLLDEGLITTTAGSGAFVAQEPDEDEEGGELESSIVTLDRCLETALKEGEVTIDFFGFTCETLATLLKPRLDKMRRLGAFRPSSLKVRVIVPSMDANLALPRNVSDPDDLRPLERLRKIISRYISALDDSITEFRLQGIIPDAQLEVRAVGMTPQVKLYIINRDVALRGWYLMRKELVQLPLEDGSGGTEAVWIQDLRGLEAQLIPQRPASTVAAQEWFNSTWESEIAMSVDPSSIPRV